jgi:release factor glutamine methyltransferase
MNIDIDNYNREYLNKYLDKSKLEEGIKRYEAGEPVQYIVGNVDFYGLEIDIDKRVLIPRFETEELVDIVTKILKENNMSNIDILDIGTGSGCIALALKNNIKDANVIGVDISLDAIDVANSNKSKLKLDVTFKQSDVFSNVSGKYDVIISNPPYIPFDGYVEDIVKNNEPNNALFAADNGLYYYDKILKECSNYIKDKYLIAFEIGEGQGNDIKDMAQKYLGSYVKVDIINAMNGLERFVIIRGELWK